MEELRGYITLGIQVVITIVTLVWFFAKLDKKIALLNQKIDLKFDNVGKDIKEIKENHLQHLAADLKECNEKLTRHLIDHNK